jgi:hypothetical protein
VLCGSTIPLGLNLATTQSPLAQLCVRSM